MGVGFRFNCLDSTSSTQIVGFVLVKSSPFLPYSLRFGNILLGFPLYYIGYYCVETGIVISVDQSCILIHLVFYPYKNGRQNILEKRDK